MGARIFLWCKGNTDTLLYVCQLGIVALIFFGVGIIYAQHFLFLKESFTIQEPLSSMHAVSANLLDIAALPTKTVPSGTHNITQKSAVQSPNTHLDVQRPSKGEYVASKNGKNYYKISCKNRIKEENKVYFQSEEDAKKAGYTPSVNCFK